MEMKHLPAILIFLLLACVSADAQWTKIYQTDSCHCFAIRSPLAGLAFFGSDSGAVCSEGNSGVTAITKNGGLAWNDNALDSSKVPYVEPAGYDQGSTSYFLDLNNIWFCGQQERLCHTSDGGKNWSVDTNSFDYSAICVCFVDTLVGFVGGGEQTIYRTSNGGRTWQLVNSPIANGYDVYQIQFCNPQLGIAISGDLHGLIMRTIDSGKTWALTTGVNYAGFGPAVSLSYPDSLNSWFTDGASIFHSSDGGLNWTRVSGEMAPLSPFRSISFIDSIHGIATASSGTTLVLGYTSNGGNSWLTTSFDSEARHSFTSFPNFNAAYIGGSDAVYKLDVQALSVPSGSGLNLSNTTVFPNPVSGTAKINFISGESSTANVTIFDVLGNPVAVLFEGTLASGAHSFEWNSNTVSDGTYYVRVEEGGTVRSLKVVKE